MAIADPSPEGGRFAPARGSFLPNRPQRIWGPRWGGPGGVRKRKRGQKRKRGYSGIPRDTNLFDPSPRAIMEQAIRTDRDACTLIIEGDVEEAEESDLAEGNGDLLFVGCIRRIVQARDLGNDPTIRLLALPQLEAEITSVKAFGLMSRNAPESSWLVRVDGDPEFVSDLDRQLCLVGSCIQ
jgi:hypothetical protein